MRHESDVHTLAGSYAMDAISAPDRARFDRHLARCEDCAREIASLHEATARLAAAAAVSPPPALKARVMAAAAATRQQPPGLEPEAALRTWPLRTWPVRAWRGRPAPSRRLAMAAGAVAAAAAVAAAVVFGVSNGGMRDQLSRAQASSQQVAAVLTARDATMMTGAVRGGGTVTIVMSHSMRKLVFTAAALHALPASRGYELWLIGPAGDRAVIMLPPARHGMTGPVTASGLRPGDHLALTAEPAVGAAHPAGHPTTPMMLDVVL
ncbi:MAG TPA: anti-sigma factor [Streptosporangiaceae bacterium]|nr:anti-sigma factor [Streptosporangiaceae bacterium]